MRTAITLILFCAAFAAAAQTDLWSVARKNRSVHQFSTLFTAQDVGGALSTDAGIDEAVVDTLNGQQK